MDKKIKNNKCEPETLSDAERKLIYTLREDTGEGVMHCKLALKRAEWDYEKAKDILKEIAIDSRMMR